MSRSRSRSKMVRLQAFVTPEVDDRLDDLAEVMGMHKNEIIRVAIANYLFGMQESVNIVRDMAEKDMFKAEE
jgi:predicted transcriptional regulator